MEKRPERHGPVEDRLARLNQALYSYSECDYLAGVSRGTSKRWLSGYTYHDLGGRFVAQPPVTPGTSDQADASFIDLIEVVEIGRLKDVGFSLRLIRQIVQNCQEFLRVDRPLVTLKFKTDGREIFVAQGEALLEVGRKRGLQAWDQVLAPFLEDLDYADQLVTRWWPLGRNKPIVVDPDYGHGFPVIADSGVRTEIVLERFKAGALPREIAEDFNITETEVDRALQFELARAA